MWRLRRHEQVPLVNTACAGVEARLQRGRDAASSPEVPSAAGRSAGRAGLNLRRRTATPHHLPRAAGPASTTTESGGAPGGTAAGFSSPVRAAADQLPARPPASSAAHRLYGTRPPADA